VGETNCEEVLEQGEASDEAGVFIFQIPYGELIIIK
jgi:hypothetical protein